MLYYFLYFARDDPIKVYVSIGFELFDFYIMDSHADSQMLPVNCLLSVCYNEIRCFSLKLIQDEIKRSGGTLFLVLCIRDS